MYRLDLLVEALGRPRRRYFQDQWHEMRMLLWRLPRRMESLRADLARLRETGPVLLLWMNLARLRETIQAKVLD